MGISSDLGQPFHPRQKRWGLPWKNSRLSRYDIRIEEALPPSITVIARLMLYDILLLINVLEVFFYESDIKL